MKCKSCNNKIPDGSLFCMYCGEKLTRTKKEKQAEIKVPKARQLKSGKWNIELRAEGTSVTEETEELCTLKARAIRAEFIKENKKAESQKTLSQVMTKYVEENDGVLSPSTIAGYYRILKNRFKDYKNVPIDKIDYQKMIQKEAEHSSPKTVTNGWGLLTASFNAAGISVPKVNIPKVPKKEGDWLDYDEILIFVEHIKGDSCELPMLLALHSLRISEIISLDSSKIRGDFIDVRCAIVKDKNNQYVKKETNKSETSTRTVPIMIPRLKEILPTEGKIVTISQSTIRNHVYKACEQLGFIRCSIHDLRRSFCCLAYHLRWTEQTTMQIGGWEDSDTVHNVYQFLSAKDKNKDVEKMKKFYTKSSKNIVKK